LDLQATRLRLMGAPFFYLGSRNLACRNDRSGGNFGLKMLCAATTHCHILR
jgi:hypothetical protein